jgi:type I restriction enzyme S subunit
MWDPDRQTENVWLSIADLPQARPPFVFESKEHISHAGAAGGKKVKKGTLLVSFKLTLGRLAFAGRDLYTNEAIAALTILDDSALSREYLYWYLTFFDWDNAARGEDKIKGKTLNKAKLELLKVILPPLSEQNRITAILDEAFTGIDAAIASAEKNLANARELFDSYLSSIFSQKGVGWIEMRLKDVCELRNGRAYSQPELLSRGKYPVLRVGNFFSNRSWYYSDLELDPTKYCEAGDLLYAWSASFGPRIWNGDKVIYHYHIWRVDIRPSVVSKHFLYYWFQWDAERIKHEMGAGTTMMHVSKKSMDSRVIAIPPLMQQQRITDRIRELESEAKSLQSRYQQKLTILSELKQSILQKAFAGELTAEEAGREMAAA